MNCTPSIFNIFLLFSSLDKFQTECWNQNQNKRYSYKNNATQSPNLKKYKIKNPYCLKVFFSQKRKQNHWLKGFDWS